jgi:hypothetical protein
MTFPSFYPREYGISLLGVYGVWLLVIVLMYPLCRWMVGSRRAAARGG